MQRSQSLISICSFAAYSAPDLCQHGVFSAIVCSWQFPFGQLSLVRGVKQVSDDARLLDQAHLLHIVAFFIPGGFALQVLV